jgi:hypothetical protein
MPCSPRYAGAVVAKNYVLGRSVHTPQTRPGGTPPGVLSPSTAVGNVTSRPGCAAEPFSNGKYGGFAVPRHATTARRARQQPWSPYPHMSAPVLAARVILVSLVARPNCSREHRGENFAHRENYGRLTR